MSESTQHSAQRRARLWIAGGIAAAVLAVSAGAVTTLVTQGSGDTPEAGATPSASSTAPPAETPASEPAPEPTASSVPADCTGVFAADYIAMMQENNYPLNDPTFTLEVGTRDEVLAALIPTLPTLRCTWGGASESGLITNVSQVTPEQSLTVEARLNELGYRCYAELDGRRCVTQQETNEDGTVNRSGESHFLRDDLWLATLWINATPPDYTPSMVRTIWGA
ncbi:hypothetical protein [Okibacterium endophyticum]